MSKKAESHPLADRIRPKSLDEFVGQKHLVGKGKPIYQSIKNNRIHSMIFWGPPGVGKTTLARIIANSTNRPFHNLSAVAAGKDEMRAVVAEARRGRDGHRDLFTMNQPEESSGAVLFLDEIHRFNKAQQDFLLPYVEDGTLILIGATTENPSFEVISALLSRSQVFVLEPLSVDEVREIIGRGVKELDVAVNDDAMNALAEYANGDARQALNLLETATALYASEKAAVVTADGAAASKANSRPEITIEHLRDALQSKHLRYDKAAEEHYNTISAFIKSMRASNPDAALYYLARMVDAGEDPIFIARRMVIFASEDVGLADPNALNIANAVFRAVETVGLPECQFHLAHGTTYLANAAKDRSAGDGYFAALEDVKTHGNLPIPLNLRNAPTKLMKDMGYGKAAETPGEKALLPEKLKDQKYLNRKTGKKKM